MRLSPIHLETSSFFILDSLTNATDFAFHFWMGRVLIPADFALLQTLNSVLLVYATASGVFQPVIGRFVAEARGTGRPDSIPAIFQTFLRAAFWLGCTLAVVTFFFSDPIGLLFKLPGWTIQISAVLILLSTLRPIAIGMLQGQERFLPFGFARFLTAFGRLVLAVILIRYGFGLTGAVIAFPFGWLIGVLIAFLFLGQTVWKQSEPAPADILKNGWKLSAYAVVAFFAFMSLTSLDLVWVNRNLNGELAGAYASLVLMRRIVMLLPGVAVTIMFPRIARALAEGQRPHRLLIRTAAIIVAAGGLLTILYFVFAAQLIKIIFSNSYQVAAPLLGRMGVATIGISLSSIWLNYYLAEKPRNFVILLGVAVILEWLFLSAQPSSLQNAVFAFGATGWLLSLSGFLLFIFHSRSAARLKIKHDRFR